LNWTSGIPWSVHATGLRRLSRFLDQSTPALRIRQFSFALFGLAPVGFPRGSDSMRTCPETNRRLSAIGGSWRYFMPFEYRLDHARQRLTIIGRDPAGVPDVLAWLDRQVADGAWAYASLDDLRRVTLKPTTQDVHRILDQVTMRSTEHGPRGPVAVVATHPALFGMASLYAALVDLAVGDVEVFSVLAEARHWLDERQALTT
jgi:hypothetical protein